MLYCAHVVKNITIDWETLEGATDYKWQLSYTPGFASIPSGFEGETHASSTRLPALDLATTYYWRVRVTEPVLSPWSATWSFTTILASASDAPDLRSPGAAAVDVSIKPVFQWGAVSGAEKYELLVSAEAGFTSQVIAQVDASALPTTAWQSETSLNYSTTYFWKVRALGAETPSAWSAVGAFTTVKSPEPPATPTTPTPSAPAVPQPPSQPPATQPAIPDWALYLFGGMLLVIMILIITLLVLVMTIRDCRKSPLSSVTKGEC